MNEDLIQLPEIQEIKEMFQTAREEIKAEVEENEDLAPLSGLIFQVMDIIEEKISKQKDLNSLPEREKIDFAAYLNFLQSLQEDFFFFEEEDFEREFEDEESSEEK